MRKLDHGEPEPEAATSNAEKSAEARDAASL
jgi:hypothetical protein